MKEQHSDFFSSYGDWNELIFSHILSVLTLNLSLDTWHYNQVYSWIS